MTTSTKASLVTQKPIEAPKAEFDWSKYDGGVRYTGQHIQLPEDPDKMPYNDAIEHLKRLRDSEEQELSFREVFDAHPHDAAVAMQKSMLNLFGWSSPQSMMTFFGPRPPQMLTVKTGAGPSDFVQIPQGEFKVPGLDNPIHLYIDQDDYKFILRSDVKKKDQPKLVRLVEEAKRILREDSIYKGKAIRFRVNDEGEVIVSRPPEFIDVSRPVTVILDDAVRDQVNDSILVPIRFTEQVKALGIPLKRGVLLAGPFGTGKTLVATWTAHEAEKNGWTFILLDRVQGLDAALQFANRYAPAVVFAEDIDRIMSDRDDDANDLINTIDGVVSKNSEVMTILTTNNIEKIHPVILRPGRLDAVIFIDAPRAEGVEKLVRFYAGSLLDQSENLDEVRVALSGQIPATIREVVERSKLGMVGRGSSQISAKDLLSAAQTMKNHMALLSPPVEATTPAQKLADGLQEVLHINGHADIDGLAEGLAGQIHKRGGMMVLPPKRQ